MAASAAPPSCKACHNALNARCSVGRKNDYDLLVCPACGTVTVDPFPTIEDLEKFYQAYKDKANYRAKEKKKVRRSLRRIKRMIRLAPGKRFLDVGCNYGFAVMAALKLGLDAHGIDIDSAAIASDKEVIGEKYFSLAPVEEFASRNLAFDMLYTSEVIEHVPTPTVLSKAHRNC